MSSLSRETVLAALQGVVDLSLVSGVVVRGGNVGFLIGVTAENAAEMEGVRRICEQRVSALRGVEKVTAVLTAEAAAAPAQKPSLWNREPVDGVKRVIAVASGKGGVGKSTVSVCLAQAFATQGMRVGILDADIYGPSIPTMFGIRQKPEVIDGKIQPVTAHGIVCMSIGLLMGEQAAVMRAPMITKALNQMLRGTEWKGLDVLIIDLPPGTGDVQLSLAQQVPIDGAVIVTTPQRVAVIDAQKALDMMRKVGIPVLGVVENMAYLDAGGVRLHPFGEGGGASLADYGNAPLLGQVPLLPELGKALDKGEKIAIPDAFSGIVTKLSKDFSFLA